ncbi:hypothetical protein NL676_039544 [Syzygium grande]|nr:hypothetical protein NL676_039544 [Syzygium grande]
MIFSTTRPSAYTYLLSNTVPAILNVCTEEGPMLSKIKVSTIANRENPSQDEHFYVFVAHPVVKVEFHVKDNDAFGAELMEVVEIPVAKIVSGDMVND